MRQGFPVLVNELVTLIKMSLALSKRPGNFAFFNLEVTVFKAGSG